MSEEELSKRVKHWKEYLMDTTWLADMGHTDEEIQHYTDANKIIDDLQDAIAALNNKLGTAIEATSSGTGRDCPPQQADRHASRTSEQHG